MERKLAAILAADIAGYSRLMAEDEEATLRTLASYRGVIAQLVDEHAGRIFGTAGDSVIAEFASPVQAVRTAVAIQRALNRHNADLPPERRMAFRIGVHLGDVVAEGADLLGDGVNIAARLEQLAEPGGILVSHAVSEQIEGKVTFPCSFAGERAAKNLPRPLRTYQVDWRQPDMLGAGPAGSPAAPGLPDKPSIAVLPFTNMGSDPEQEYFADGICEDIITALAKWRWLFVIARNTSFVYKGKAVDIKQVGRELGVRYVLEGSVRKAGNRVRITAQLIEAATGAHIWSERYDRDLADAFAVQDDITESVVGAIEPELLLVERQHAAQRTATSADAWDSYLRGMWHFCQFSPQHHERAEHHMHQAIACNPTSAQGYIGLSRVINARVWFGWSTDLERDCQASYAAARRAVEIDDRDSYAHYTLAWASMPLGRQEDAVAEAQKSIDLTPNFALGYFALGVTRLFFGRFDQVADPFQRAMRLSPHEPLTFLFANFLALAEYHQGHYEKAVKIAQMALALRPFHTLYRTLAACYGQLGRREEAAAALAEMHRLNPPAAVHHWQALYPYANPAHLTQLIDGLHKAGLAVDELERLPDTA
jgi:TolB-like protein/class 3 adenylate cyclase